MKRQIAEKWVRALVSGKYKQGTGYLLNEGRYCCLGVVCSLYPTQTQFVVEDEFANEDASSTAYLYGKSDNEEALPSPDALKFLGMTDEEANRIFAELNDIERLSFDQIADVVGFIYGVDVDAIRAEQGLRV